MSQTKLPRACWIVPSLLALAAASIGACSADPDENDTTGTNSGGAGASGQASGSGAEAVSIGVANGGANGTNTGGGCVGTGKTAEKVPLDLFVMLDQSGSMSEPGGNGQSKWNVTLSALGAFVQQPQTAGIGMGLQYFGLGVPAGCPAIPFCSDDAACGPCGPCEFPIAGSPFGVCAGATDSCDAADYATAEVPIQPLPGVADQIIASLQSHSPNTGTPTQPALKGAIMFASDWALQNPSHVTAVVLATDGIPQACNSTASNTAAEAAAGLAATPSIRTFVIGVGNALADLNLIAAAGGTNQAFLVDTNANAQDAFVDALNEIQGAALPCAYTIPDPPAGEELDFDQVNVEYKPGDGSPPTTLSQVDSEAACGAAGGWYYDNPAAPSQILLCPASCDLVSGVQGSEVDVVFGCATKVD